MRRVLGLALVAALAVTGLTACMSDDGGDRRTAALASGTATGAVPFQAPASGVSISIPVNANSGSDSFVVPAGKRLVIEHISVLVSLPVGQVPYVSHILANAGGVNKAHYLSTLVATPSTSHKFSLSQALTLYADPGTTVSFTVSRSPATSGSGSFNWALSGYLVDA